MAWNDMIWTTLIPRVAGPFHSWRGRVLDHVDAVLHIVGPHSGEAVSRLLIHPREVFLGARASTSELAARSPKKLAMAPLDA